MTIRDPRAIALQVLGDELVEYLENKGVAFVFQDENQDAKHPTVPPPPLMKGEGFHDEKNEERRG